MEKKDNPAASVSSTEQPVSCRVCVVGAYAENCVLLHDAEGNAWLVDPGAEPDVLLGALRREGLRLRRVLLTHGHLDHISAIPAILEAFPGTPVTMHAEDAAWAFTEINSFPPYVAVLQTPATLQTCAGGDVVADGGLRATVLHTPGHSPGGVCYLVEGGPLLSGDTLFQGSCGRTDLPGGNPAKLARSLRSLAALPPATKVVSGHGPMTTIGDEIRYNPFLSLGHDDLV